MLILFCTLDFAMLQAEDSMYGLIYHELGHVYHKQYGLFQQYSDDNRQRFVWQLFTEGIAMYFEQVLVNAPDYYHQNRNGWREWCDNHFQQILEDFDAELPTMTRSTQRYFDMKIEDVYKEYLEFVIGR